MKTATDYAREVNAKTREWLAANPGGWAGLLVEDAEFWAEQGVHTYDDLDRLMAVEAYSDAYKEEYGMRPRRDWTGVPTASIRAAYRALCELASENAPAPNWIDDHATVAADGSRSWTL